MLSTRPVFRSSFALPAVVLVAGLIGLAPAGADDKATYDLLGPALKKGQVIKTTTKSTLKGGKVTLDDGNMKLEFDMETVNTSEKQIDLLEVKGRKVQKAKVKIIKDEGTKTVGVGGMSKEEDEKSPLAGETVMLERTKAGWKRTLADNTDPTDAQKKKMEAIELDSWEEAVFPAKKVAAGHKWEIDASKLTRLFDSAFSDGSGKVKGHFVKTEKVGDQPCAVIELDMDVKGTATMAGEKVKVEFKGKVTLHRSPALGANLKSKADLNMKMAGKTKLPTGEADLEVKGKLAADSTATVK